MSLSVETWMDGYLLAWGSNEPDDIRALFTEDAEYFPAPHVHPAIGHDAIVDWWLTARDEPGDYEFGWRPVAVTPETAVIRGRTDYADGRSYENLWVIEFAADGRASRYTEWYMSIDAKDVGAPPESDLETDSKSDSNPDSRTTTG
ncbi:MULTISPECIES: nuclear transport factor 2 family protein [unclassified Leifsonia]|uniref:nuclear transport factor 2 family protein n=1 Tax=unclassified Leifsonia TaxID=2663824 RepID=UPI0009EB3A13|nr:MULTISPECIES: nuclear transport factor 2 family protein [unclassified Leifsonia]